MAAESFKNLLQSARAPTPEARAGGCPPRHLVCLLARQAAREVIVDGVEAAAPEKRQAALDLPDEQRGSR
jgi:hypothetical protein